MHRHQRIRHNAESRAEPHVPRITFSASGSARYDLGRDRIELPGPERFASRQACYRTAIDEVGDWPGRSSREYAREDLRAEIHSCLTGCRLGLGYDADGIARWPELLGTFPEWAEQDAARWGAMEDPAAEAAFQSLTRGRPARTRRPDRPVRGCRAARSPPAAQLQAPLGGGAAA